MATNSRSAFVPNTAATVSVAATTTSGSTQVALVGTGPNLLVQNLGASTAFIEQGSSAVTAAVATGFPVAAGAVFVIGRAPGATHVAGITSSGAATMYVTTGEGD